MGSDTPDNDPDVLPADRTCFVISPIGEERSETRSRSDQVLKHVIVPAAEELGLTAVRSGSDSRRPG